MRLEKKVSRIFAYFVVGLLISGCESRFFNKDELIYSSMGGLDISFDLNEMFYSSGHLSSPINDCSSVEFPKCLIFDSTIIMLPKLDIIDNIGDYYLGRNENLGLDYNVTEMEIKVLGEKIKGYMFYVAHTNEMNSGDPLLGELKGHYFYSLDSGILFYEHNSEIFLSNRKPSRLSNLNWSTTGCGIFSNKCMK